jgi:preprotein translocase subunit SecA
MNKQREIIYDERRKVLFDDDVKEYIMQMMEDLVKNTIQPITIASKFSEEWDLDTLNENLKRITGNFEPLSYTEEEKRDLTEAKLTEDALAVFHRLYEEKEAEIGADKMREVEKMILLRVVDNHWMDHIDAMDDLKQGIGLRALGQINPANAYAAEGFDMFEEMTGEICEEAVRYCYNVTVNTGTERKQVISGGEDRKEDYNEQQSMASPMQSGAMGGAMPSSAPKPVETRKPETVRREEAKIGRNDPCPCGSGKKYKNCCGKDK